MEDTSRNDALALCAALEDKGAGAVTALGLGPECSWASYLVIGTATSGTHMRGLAKAAAQAASERDMSLRNSSKSVADNGWLLLDCGDVVVNLMDSETREYYALEDLWYEAERVYQSSRSS